MKLQLTEDYEVLVNKDHPNYKTRNLVFYGGRGSLKSTSVAQGLLVRASEDSGCLVLCARELQNSISDSVIKTLQLEINRIGMESFYEVQTQRIIGKNGSEFIFKGIKNNVNSIKSIPNIKYCWIEEAQTISHSSLEVLIPTLRIPGSQLLFTFNPLYPTDPVYERYVKNPSNDTYVKFVNYDRNPFISKEIIDEINKLRESDKEAYEHVYEGKFDNRRTGAVYAKQLQSAHKDGRITKVPYDPSFPVFTAWDLGYGDSTAIWFLQFVGRELRWIDYYESSGEQLDHYVKLLNSKPYNYSMAYLPFDGAHGNIRGFSVTQQLSDMGVKNTVLKNSSLESGIEELRKTLAFSVFDSNKCADGLHCLEHYAYEWDEDKKMFKTNPKHDWTSHGSDAARYAAIAAALQKGSLVVNKDTSLVRKKKSWMA